jgi:hypothetical protein
MRTKEEVLQHCTVEGLVVKLPDVQLDRKVYQEVAKSLELIVGKWKTGKKGFLFAEDPTELLDQLCDTGNQNLKKDYQFFESPESLAEYLVELADINSPDLMVLEPSAGQGAIVKAILKHDPELIVHAYELMGINRTFLSRIKDCIVLGEDYLTSDTVNFDRIVANPPFSKNQDIDHIKKMYRNLKREGRLVTCASNAWCLPKGGFRITNVKLSTDVK